MIEPRHHDAALTHEEVDKILRYCGPRSLLVGGQALAFWALHYEIEPVGALSAKITSDADFIGTATDARRLGAAMNWKVWIATLDDATVQTAKVTTVRTHRRFTSAIPAPTITAAIANVALICSLSNTTPNITPKSGVRNENTASRPAR